MPEATRVVAGRGREFELLQQLWGAAQAGEPQLLLLLGEAGVGKTHLADALARHASPAQVLYARGSEDLQVANLALSTALGPLLRSSPRLAAMLTGHQPPEEVGPDSLDRALVLLLHEVIDTLLTAADAGPVLLTVDDVQWIDDSSAKLLEQVLSILMRPGRSALPLLVVLCARRPESGSTAGTRLIDRLRTQPGSHVLRLSPLDQVGLSELIIDMTGSAPSSASLRDIEERTGGVPALVRSAVADPTGFGESSAAVIERVSPTLRRLLSAAAVVGDQSSLSVLGVVLREPVEDVEKLVRDAAEVLAFDDQGVRFHHRHDREALLDALSAGDRQELHARVAEALAADGAAPTLVLHHQMRAGDLVPADRRFESAWAAGAHALATCAWGDAAEAYAEARASMPETLPWEDRLRVLTESVWATFHDFDPDTAEAIAREAIALAKEHGATELWGMTLLALLRAQETHSSTTDGPSLDLVAEFLAAVGDDHPALRARLHGLLGECAMATADLETANREAATARSIVDAHDDVDADTRYWVACSEGLVAILGLDVDRAAIAFSAAHRLSDAAFASDPWPGQVGPVRLAITRHVQAEIVEADQVMRSCLDAMGTSGTYAERSVATAGLANISLALGALAEAERRALDSGSEQRRSQYPFSAALSYPALAQTRAYRGDLERAHDVLGEWQELGGVGGEYIALAVDAVAGDLAEVRRKLSGGQLPPPPALALAPLVPAIAAYGEAVVRVRDAEGCALALPGLEMLYEHGIRTSIGWVASVARIAAEAYAVRGDVEAAREWAARAVAETGALPVERARLDLLDARMTPSDPRRRQRERAALERLDAIGAVGLVASEDLRPLDPDPATRVLVFTDLTDSTELNARTGDATWTEMIREHDALAAVAVDRHGGTIFKHLGDGFAAWFETADAALLALEELSAALRRASAFHPDVPLRLRAGVAAGEPIGHAGDLFGLAVNRAARLVELAAPEEVLLGEEVAPLLDGLRDAIELVGPQRLKGFPDEVLVHRHRPSVLTTTER